MNMAGQRSRYNDWLRAGRSGDRIPVGTRFSAPVQTGPGAHPVSCTMGTGSLPGGKERPGRDADPSPPSSAVVNERVELYLYSPYGPYALYRASVPVQGCTLRSFMNNGQRFQNRTLRQKVSELSMFMTALSVVNWLMETPLVTRAVMTITGMKQKTLFIVRNVTSRPLVSGTQSIERGTFDWFRAHILLMFYG